MASLLAPPHSTAKYRRDPSVAIASQLRRVGRAFYLGDARRLGVGSQFTAQGFASIGYQWTPSISTSVGYRAIYTDYRDGGFLYNTTQHGLYSSLAYHF